MSRRAETLVWERSRAKGSDLLVLLSIADCASQDGLDAWMSVRHLAEHARLTERGTRYVLHRLEADGELRITMNTARRVVDTGHRRFVPEWFIDVRCVSEWEPYQDEVPARDGVSVAFPVGRRDRAVKPEKIADSAGAKNGKDATANRKPVSEEMGKNTSNNGKSAVSHIEILERDPRTLIQELDPPAPSALVDRFNRFWSVYPKKVGKDAAWRAWQKRKPSDQLTAEMLAALECQREYLARDDGQYTPNPATWLNEGRWQDEPPAVRPRTTRPFTATELADARQVLRARGGCPHDPTCDNSQACVGSIIRQWRYQRGDAA